MGQTIGFYLAGIYPGTGTFHLIFYFSHSRFHFTRFSLHSLFLSFSFCSLCIYDNIHLPHDFFILFFIFFLFFLRKKGFLLQQKNKKIIQITLKIYHVHTRILHFRLPLNRAEKNSLKCN